ncbi:hypothetical protein Sulac_2891 [Sulfobacillus acidophilus DSM 10332]|uniref:Uncharacterized protein n=1 Tax=Sulfobacillus acidophilus (strain ATCC 700253 / DSM 10332 / NAL) TaxID=679936 RepID=G8TZ82_SULAD|nr:hypothetical protein Sulac_2891 [Sulfobacillus acidophilus DSM 10332]
MRHRRWSWGVATGILLGSLFGFVQPTGATSAKPPAVVLVVRPQPPEALVRNVFLITTPVTHGLTPQSLIIRYQGGGHRLTVRLTLSHPATGEWEALWAPPAPGRMTAEVEAAHGVVLTTKSYPVVKPKPQRTARIIVGALFIGLSLWYWWRMQRFYRRR